MFMVHPFQAVVETCDAQVRLSAEGDGSMVALEVIAITPTESGTPNEKGTYVKFEKVIDAVQAGALLWLMNSPYEATAGQPYELLPASELGSLTDTMYRLCKPITDELMELGIRLIP